MWKEGTCDECGSKALVKRSRGKNLCRDCYREARRKRKLEQIRTG